LQFIHEPQNLIIETYDVSIGIRSEASTKALSNVDPAKMVLQRRAGAELMKTYFWRAPSGELRWTGTLYPTSTYAQDAEMSLGEYEDFRWATGSASHLPCKQIPIPCMGVAHRGSASARHFGRAPRCPRRCRPGSTQGRLTKRLQAPGPDGAVQDQAAPEEDDHRQRR
jgi:hypothetical protein